MPTEPHVLVRLALAMGRKRENPAPIMHRAHLCHLSAQPWQCCFHSKASSSPWSWAKRRPSVQTPSVLSSLSPFSSCPFQKPTCPPAPGTFGPHAPPAYGLQVLPPRGGSFSNFFLFEIQPCALLTRHPQKHKTGKVLPTKL